jgi:hypothetical protein
MQYNGKYVREAGCWFNDIIATLEMCEMSNGWITVSSNDCDNKRVLLMTTYPSWFMVRKHFPDLSEDMEPYLLVDTNNMVVLM